MTSAVTPLRPAPEPRTRNGPERRRPSHRERIGDLKAEIAALREQLAAAVARRRGRAMTAVTVGTAVVLPAFSVSATLQTGALWTEGSPAMWATGFIAVCLFLVSTRHVAAGVQAAMQVSLVDGWLLALAIDGAIVGGEIARLGGGVPALAWAMMGAGAVLSAIYNAIGFTAEKASSEEGLAA